jgi:hypothetical protein
VLPLRICWHKSASQGLPMVDPRGSHYYHSESLLPIGVKQPKAGISSDRPQLPPFRLIFVLANLHEVSHLPRVENAFSQTDMFIKRKSWNQNMGNWMPKLKSKWKITCFHRTFFFVLLITSHSHRKIRTPNSLSEANLSCRDHHATTSITDAFFLGRAKEVHACSEAHWNINLTLT